MGIHIMPPLYEMVIKPPTWRLLLSEKWNTDPTPRWYFSDANWQLSTDEYVSSPTSLRETINGIVEFILPKVSVYPATLCIPEGEISSWFFNYWDAGRERGFRFRNQSPEGGSDSPGYKVLLSPTAISVLINFDASEEGVCSWSVTVPTAEWSRWKLRWWNEGVDLALELFSWDGSKWVSEGVEYGLDADGHNLYKDSAINRAGLELSYRSYIDDTEIRERLK